MPPITLARLILRLDGFFMLFGSLVQTTYLAPFLRFYAVYPEGLDLRDPLGQDAAAAILRIVIELLFAAVLVGATDSVARLLVPKSSEPVSAMSPSGLGIVLVRQIAIWTALSCLQGATPAVHLLQLSRSSYPGDGLTGAATQDLRLLVVRVALNAIATVLVFAYAQKLIDQLVGAPAAEPSR